MKERKHVRDSHLEGGEGRDGMVGMVWHGHWPGALTLRKREEMRGEEMDEEKEKVGDELLFFEWGSRCRSCNPVAEGWRLRVNVDGGWGGSGDLMDR